MMLQTSTWESRLLLWAHEARETPALVESIDTESAALQHALEYCRSITKANSRTFYLASSLLTAEKRKAVQALYAFCRSTDDMVDTVEREQEIDRLMQSWRNRLANPHPAAHDPVPLAWASAQRRYCIPHGYVEQLIQGIQRDRIQRRYACFADLAEYCYGVASTVGLISMHIVGFCDDRAVPYAVRLGVALQLTNILRDVGEDWSAGRLYLPQDELEHFGVGESDIAAGLVTDRWRALMRFQIERAHRLYDEAHAGIAMLDADGRFAIAAAAGLYRAILGKIEENDYDVFRRRASLGAWGKLRRLPAIWLQSRSTQDRHMIESA